MFQRSRQADVSLDELLSAQSDVLKFSSPPVRVKNALTGWFYNAQCFVGLGKQTYFKDHKDFVALRPAKGEDRLSQFLRDHCSHWMKVITQFSFSKSLILSLI